ncbi:hypothetical protein Y1Q_0007753 [Alligator mississippiensis]|uniref:Uncharacterized protein n=1 Tax=Alligator mississippiensis TaxID=8496 RepID=A0A151N6U7_ALLMI|nr:hypothetical protein Y1Q_0007753 [Alligator mississippiensis]
MQNVCTCGSDGRCPGGPRRRSHCYNGGENCNSHKTALPRCKFLSLWPLEYSLLEKPYQYTQLQSKLKKNIYSKGFFSPKKGIKLKRCQTGRSGNF